MIDIRKLKELVRLMVTNELTELDLRDSEEQVTLRRGAGAGEPPVVTVAPVAAAVAATAPVEEPVGAGDDDGLAAIESPMVGTFYSAPNPDAEPFVRIGTIVDPDTVVYIMEAMKIFNEIKAETSGTIAKVLVSSGEAVEFGQPLFLVKPS